MVSLRDLKNIEIAKMVAFFSPLSNDAYIVKTILQDRYESLYKWGDIPGHSLANVITTDLVSGKKVLETKELQFIQNSQGLFQGLEYHYSDEKIVCITEFVRDLGSGLLVKEQIRQGSLPADYHIYEFVLIGWPWNTRPAGAAPGFRGGFGRGF